MVTGAAGVGDPLVHLPSPWDKFVSRRLQDGGIGHY